MKYDDLSYKGMFMLYLFKESKYRQLKLKVVQIRFLP